MKIQFSNNFCGICEQPGATKLWHNPLSNRAHDVCLRWIHRENSALQSLLDQTFPESLPYRNLAQSLALEVIKKKIGDVSILNFKKSRRGDELLAYFASQQVRDTLFEIKHQAKTHYNY